MIHQCTGGPTHGPRSNTASSRTSAPVRRRRRRRAPPRAAAASSAHRATMSPARTSMPPPPPPARGVRVGGAGLCAGAGGQRRQRRRRRRAWPRSARRRRQRRSQFAWLRCAPLFGRASPGMGTKRRPYTLHTRGPRGSFHQSMPVGCLAGGCQLSSSSRQVLGGSRDPHARWQLSGGTARVPTIFAALLLLYTTDLSGRAEAIPRRASAAESLDKPRGCLQLAMRAPAALLSRLDGTRAFTNKVRWRAPGDAGGFALMTVGGGVSWHWQRLCML